MPVYPWASMPQRASTYQTANRCQASVCQPHSTGCWPKAHIPAESVSQQAPHRGVSGAAARCSGRASQFTPRMNSAAKTGSCHPAKPLYINTPRI